MNEAYRVAIYLDELADYMAEERKRQADGADDPDVDLYMGPGDEVADEEDLEGFWDE